MSEEAEIGNPEEISRSSNSLFLAGCGIVTAIAAFLRFFLLELRPLHHDEGVNGFFLLELFKSGSYAYDPSNYHGPTLYFNTLAFTKILGMETFSVRTSVAIYGLAIVILAFFLRRYIGTIGSLAAGLFLALSPGMVFISRYFIHEIIFVFLSLAIVVSILYFMEGRIPGVFATVLMSLLLLVCFIVLPFGISDLVLKLGIAESSVINPNIITVLFFLVEGVWVFFLMKFLLGWDEGRAIYLILASASAALFFATKETAFITLGTMLISCLCVFIWRKMHAASFGESGESGGEPIKLTFSSFWEKLGGGFNRNLVILIVLLTFVYIWILFFSSFFTHKEGLIVSIKKSLEAYSFWTSTGMKDHSYGYLKYAKWLYGVESPLLALSAIGGLIALIKAKHRFALFTAFWALGLTLAYSIIPYKTPWLALSFTLPMCIIGGYGINELLADKRILLKSIGGFLLAGAIGILAYQTYDLNFQRYDDEDMTYVYAHTRRGFLDLVKKIEFYADKSERKKESSIEVVSDEYWPMPWYTREYPKATYHGKLSDFSTSEMIVASEEKQKEELDEKYGRHYKYSGTYPLRPGVDLILLIRRDLAETTDKEIYQINSAAP